MFDKGEESHRGLEEGDNGYRRRKSRQIYGRGYMDEELKNIELKKQYKK